MKPDFFRPQHLGALLLATLVLWAFRVFSTPFVINLQPPELRARWQDVQPSHLSALVFAVVIVLCISLLQDLRPAKSGLVHAIVIGGLIGVASMAGQFLQGVAPELRNGVAVRALVMGIGYVAASVVVFAGKRYSGQATARVAHE